MPGGDITKCVLCKWTENDDVQLSIQAHVMMLAIIELDAAEPGGQFPESQISDYANNVIMGMQVAEIHPRIAYFATRDEHAKKSPS